MNYVIQSYNRFFIKNHIIAGFPISKFGKANEDIMTFSTKEEAQDFIDNKILIKNCQVSLNIFSI